MTASSAPDDTEGLCVPGMLHAAVLWAPRPRVKVLAIDTAQARQTPGLVLVLTAEDLPGERFQGQIDQGWPVMIAVGEETRCTGDALALVAAETKAQARAARDRIRLEYLELPLLASPRAALAEDAPRLNPKGNLLARTVLSRGDADAAVAQAAYLSHHIFHIPPPCSASLEPASALAVPEADGTLTVYLSGQSVPDDLRGIAGVLGMPPEKVRVIGKQVADGSGGNEDRSVQRHAALLAWIARRPVKLTLARQESFRLHPEGHAMEMAFTVACDARGRLTAVKASLLADLGAYPAPGGLALQEACNDAAGPYRIANVSILGLGVRTNSPPAGAFRAFGAAQSCFAMESCLNELSAQVGLSPWQFRFQNAVEAGDVLPNGRYTDPGTALKQTLLAVKAIYGSRPDAGIACCMKNSGMGMGRSEVGRVRIRVEQGQAVVYTCAACTGEGLGMTLLQSVGQTTGLSWDLIDVTAPGPATTPGDRNTTPARRTLLDGEAAQLAALDLASDLRTQSLRELEGREYCREYSGAGDPFDSDGQNPSGNGAYAYATQVVFLDRRGKVDRVFAAHDVGQVLNPATVEARIEGGVVEGLVYALIDDCPRRVGLPTAGSGSLGDFPSPRPAIVSLLVRPRPGAPAFGAKAVGEIVSIPTAPAVAGAYFRRDGVFRTRLPLPGTPYSRRK